MLNIHYSEKMASLKLVEKVNFFGKKIWRNALASQSKKVKGIIGETFILALLSSVPFLLQKRVSDFF